MQLMNTRFVSGRRVRILAAIAVAAVIACPFTAVTYGQLSVQQLLEPYVAESTEQYKDVEDAASAFKDGRFEQSRALLHQARRKHPNLAPAEVMLARLYMSAQRLPEAKDALERAVAQERDDPEAYLLLSELALRERQIIFAELSLERSEQLLSKYKRNKRRLERMQIALHAGMATVNELRGQNEDALKHIDAWLVLSPQHTAAYSRAATNHFRQKQFDEARSMFEKLAEIDEDAQRPDVAMGLLYEEVGMRDEAHKHMLEAVKRGANELDTRLAVAEWALGAGINDLAKSNVDYALKIDASSLRGKVLAGQIARQRGDLADAEAIFEAVLVESPGNFVATNELALTLASTKDEGKKQRARKLAEVNFRLNSDQRNKAGREAAITFAWLLFQDGREMDAEKAIQMALRGGAISSESAFYISKIFAQRGKEDVAVKILRPVLAMNRSFPRRDDAQKLYEQLSHESTD